MTPQNPDSRARLGLRESATFDRTTIAAIQRAHEALPSLLPQ